MSVQGVGDCLSRSEPSQVPLTQQSIIYTQDVAHIRRRASVVVETATVERF